MLNFGITRREIVEDSFYFNREKQHLKIVYLKMVGTNVRLLVRENLEEQFNSEWHQCCSGGSLWESNRTC